MLAREDIGKMDLSMAASPFDKKKFGDLVRVHAIDGVLITREDEAQVLKVGISQFGLELNEARGILLGVAADNDIALVSNAEQQVNAFLDFSVKRNRIGRKVFNNAAGIYTRLTKGLVPDVEIRKRLKEMVLLRGWKPRRGIWLIGSRRWFRRI
jgi:hypothetical protein